MPLDASMTLALLRELRDFHERGQWADARLLFDTVRPALEPLERPEGWRGDEAQTFALFGLLAWLRSEREPKPYGAVLPDWLSTWVVTTHRDIAVSAPARFVDRPRVVAPDADAPDLNERDPVELAVVETSPSCSEGPAVQAVRPSSSGISVSRHSHFGR